MSESSKPPIISLVTGTINRLPLLQRLVTSVRGSVGSLPYEIVIVDNNSADGTREWLSEQEDVSYFNIGEPRGSAAAFQMGFEGCHPNSKYVVTLNDDIAVNDDTVVRAYRYLENHPEVGQVAFSHRYQNRDRVDPSKEIVQTAFGYPYTQCGMTRRRIGDRVGWCGPEENYTHYAWDTRLSLAIWELGYSVVKVPGCSVTDWEHVDDTRRQFSDKMRDERGRHPDTLAFFARWKDRLPTPDKWVPGSTADLSTRIIRKIANNNCRVLRFKAMMNPSHPMRTACIDALAAWGPSKQVNMDAIIASVGMQAFQARVVDIVKEFEPDFCMMQAQRPNNILPGTMEYMKRTFPNTFFFNWDGDTHYPLEDFHFQVARACHLQGLISPTMFPDYIARGAPNVCYWPIGVEKEFLEVQRDPNKLTGPDVLFLGALYGVGKFPEAETRQKAVIALQRHPKINFKVFGYGWNRVGIRTTQTVEKFDTNPQKYTQCKMSLSISQTASMWGYSSDRLYNITATGCPALVQNFAGMEEHGYIDGVTCIGWSTIPEMLDKALFYIDHPYEREEIGRRCREMVLSRHTWEHRVSGLLSMLGGLEELRR